MAGMIPVDATFPSCPMDVQEDDTSVALSSLDSDSFMFVENTHPNKILEGLNNLRLRNEFCDVILCCGGQEFSCHRNVLASFSPYFEAMFTTEWMESQQIRVAINGVEPQMIGMMVNYAYTSKVLISTANVQALLATANLLNVMAVQEACCHYLERHMHEKNCIGIHCFAEALSCKKLEKQSIDYILEHFSVVYAQDEFLSLHLDKLTEILSCDDLNVPKEEMVFEAALLWFNKCSTGQSFEKLLEHVRLPFISPSFLHDVIESLDVVKQSQGCQRLLSEAKNQDLLPYSHRAQPRRGPVILIMGGDYDSSTRVESFYPRTNQWKTLASLPFAVRNPSVVVLDSVLYLARGESYDGSTSKEMWRYDPSHDDSWLKMAPMNYAQIEESDYSLAVLDSYVYAVSHYREVGADRPQMYVERYAADINTWQLIKAPDSMCACNHPDAPVVVALDGLLYFIGVTVLQQNGFESLPQLYSYNPNTTVWTEVAPVLVIRGGLAACVLKGKIYIVGGVNDDIEPTDQVDCYDPETNQWTMCSPMKVPRTIPGVAVVDGMIYVLGGWDDCCRPPNRTIERYREDTDSWEIVGEMPSSRICFSCVSLWLRKEADIICELRERWFRTTEG